MLILALTFLVITIILLAVGLQRGSSRFTVEQRLEQIQNVDNQADEELSKPFFHRVVLPLGDKAARMFRTYTPAESSGRVHKRLVMAGLYPRVSATQLLGLCWLCAVGGFFFMVFLLLSSAGAEGKLQLSDPMNIFYLAIAAGAGYGMPQFIVSKNIEKRQQAILLSLPYTLDLLMISVEAGMGFDAALGYSTKKTKGPLSEEFTKTLNEIRLGKQRLDALEDLGNRTGVEELKNFMTAVIHSARLGGSIVNTLRIQADSIRVRRRQRAQEQGMKAPVKMVFPLVLFIFPALFVVILGPAAISIYENILK